MFLLSEKLGCGDPLILYWNRVLHLFALAMTIILIIAMLLPKGVHKRQRLAIYPASVGTSSTGAYLLYQELQTVVNYPG